MSCFWAGFWVGATAGIAGGVAAGVVLFGLFLVFISWAMSGKAWPWRKGK